MWLTDHAALQWIQGFKHPEGQLARWLEQLQEFEFKCEYRPGKTHQNADAMSRCPVNQQETGSYQTANLQIISSVSPIPCYNPPEIRDAQYADPTLRPVFEWFMSGARPATPEGLPAPVQSL